MSRVIALVATIPSRRRSCERLLNELTMQRQPPDGVALVLDGYGDGSLPVCQLPVVLERKTPAPSGAGQRWVVSRDLDPEDILICLDDDYMINGAPVLIKALAAAVATSGGAAAAMGRSADGKQAPPGIRSRGPLVYAAGCGLAVKAKHLTGLQDLSAEVVAAGGPDALGPLGDDDALVSAHLWRSRVPIVHAATGIIHPAPGTRATSQTQARAKKQEAPDAQKRLISRITGWPWPAPR